LATQLGADVRSETPISARSSSKRTVEVRMLNKIGEVETVIQAALDAGQCVCWIRNTVRDARDAYDELIGREWIDPHRLHLFHSRFAMVDRQCIETQILNWFGKLSKTAQRQGRLLLATQVVEQSLDLDFDVLVTDIAPIDLLLQRAGRLHRHPRSRDGAPATVEKRETPILYIHGPAPTQTPTETWLRDVLPGTQAVYPNVGQIWLTQQCLLKSGCIQTPGMCRQLIESVYGPDCSNEIPESLQYLTMEAEGEDAGKRGMARINRLTLSRGYTRGSAENVNGWDEDTRIPTRLGRETVRVALSRIEADRLVPYARTDEHAWEMSMLNLPKEEWQRVCAAIPPHIQQMISQIKDSEAVLKWAEVLPMCDQITGYYHARAGWLLRKERK